MNTFFSVIQHKIQNYNVIYKKVPLRCENEEFSIIYLLINFQICNTRGCILFLFITNIIYNLNIVYMRLLRRVNNIISIKKIFFLYMFPYMFPSHYLNNTYGVFYYIIFYFHLYNIMIYNFKKNLIYNIKKYVENRKIKIILYKHIIYNLFILCMIYLNIF